MRLQRVLVESLASSGITGCSRSHSTTLTAGVFLSNQINPALELVYPYDAWSCGCFGKPRIRCRSLCAMQHAHYFQAQVGRTVEDEIVLNPLMRQLRRPGVRKCRRGL